MNKEIVKHNFCYQIENSAINLKEIINQKSGAFYKSYQSS